MAVFPSIKIEGGLLGPDLLDQVVGADVPGQKPADFGLDGKRNLTDEIAATFADARALWGVFQNRLERLPEGDVATTVTRDAWMIPFLGLLGFAPTFNQRAYEIDGLSFAISHRADEGEKAPPVHVVGYRQELGRVPASGRPRLAPHSLVQEFLNRTENLWGLVTNGRILRLLRDCSYIRRQAYIEFDLQAMLEEQRFQDFAALYRLLHRTRLPRTDENAVDCLLEKYYAHSIEQGGRVRDHLRDGVEQCILRLANGFLRHPASDDLRRRVAPDCADNDRITPEDFYRQLLRLVYRFLFLLVSEDRGLLSTDPLYREHYGVARLRRLLDNRASFTDHDDLWQSLRVLWYLLNNDTRQPALNDQPMAAALGLPVLNGELFAGQSLDNASISNYALLDSFFYLAKYEAARGASWQRVNYSALDVEELGSVYESLLEFHPAVQRDAAGRLTFDLVFGSERKSTGSYYTPPELVGELIKSALEPVLSDRLKASPKDPEKAILSIRVCDPACGSGHFLLAAARRLGKELARVRTGEDEPAPERVREAIRDVVSHCIYGVDKNPLAVDLCRVALWLESHTASKPLTFLDHRIRPGDSLIGILKLDVIRHGIPDEAFEPRDAGERDDARQAARRNREERSDQERGQARFQWEVRPVLTEFTQRNRELDAIADDSPANIRRKRERYEQNHSDPSWRRQRDACDLYTSAFFQPLDRNGPAITSGALAEHLAGRSDSQFVARARTLAERHRFFHWPLWFPEAIADGGFDVLLGNPPYGAAQSQQERGFLRGTLVHSVGAANTAADFLETASRLCCPTGRVGFVLPKSLTFSYAWRDLREWLVPRAMSVVDVGKAWENVLLEQVLVTCGPEESGMPTRVGVLLAGTSRWGKSVAREITSKLSIIPTSLNDEDLTTLERMLSNADGYLDSICQTQRGAGLQRHVAETGPLPVLAGRDIAEFRTPSPRAFVDPATLPSRLLRLTVPPQAVFQNIVAHVTSPAPHIKLIGTVARQPLACLDTVNLLTARTEAATAYALCALLMCDLVNWFVYACVYNRAIRTMHFDGYFLSKIPSPRPDHWSQLHQIGISLLDEPRDQARWTALNDFVFGAFGIPTPLQRYINSMHSSRAERRGRI